MPTLTLVYNSISLSLGIPGVSPFSDGNYPRERIELPSFGRSLNGALNKEGVAYESPFIWNISAHLRPAESATLLRMFDLWLADGADNFIRVHDLIRPITERGPQTRALAAGAEAAQVSGAGASAIRTYYAAFNALFQSEPKAVKSGPAEVFTFQLIEGDKVAP